GHDLSSLRVLGTVGEPINPEAWIWYHEVIGGERCPIVDTWWQTETGWTIVGNPVGLEMLPVKIGSPPVPMPGYDVVVLGEDGRPLPAGELGAIAIKLPLPPGTL
ncbi:propionyl-CoA synthetase, partial [Enterococcus hirae]